jgi:hypothetical protein
MIAKNFVSKNDDEKFEVTSDGKRLLEFQVAHLKQRLGANLIQITQAD